jgi:fermentation-respiration switch protein FrsA (DUF1100 family)
VAVAERDSIVPTRFGVALYEALANPKRLTVFKAVGHNDWAASVDDNWWREAIVFLLGGPADRVGLWLTSSRRRDTCARPNPPAYADSLSGLLLRLARELVVGAFSPSR